MFFRYFSASGSVEMDYLREFEVSKADIVVESGSEAERRRH